MNNERKNKALTILITVVFLTWFFGSMGGLVWSSNKGMPGVTLALFGQYFLVFGGLLFTSSLKTMINQMIEHKVSNQKMSYDIAPVVAGGIMTFIGAVCTFIGLILEFGDDQMKSNLNLLAPILICMLFAIIGIVFICVAIFKVMYVKKHMTYEIEAEVISIQSHMSRDSDGHSHRVYAPVWRYLFNGQTYTKQNPISYGSKNKFHKGDVKTLRINPDNPTQIYAGPMEFMLYFILGISFTVCGIFAIVMFIMQMF